MALQCGENKFSGTANGIGYGLTRAEAETRAINDANRNGNDTEDHIIRRYGYASCPDECDDEKWFVDLGDFSAQLLTGAAAPRQKTLVIWLLFFPIFIRYWVAQAAYNLDLRWYCLKEGEELPEDEDIRFNAQRVN